jgi:hypothetical protein
MIGWRCQSNSVNTGGSLPNISDIITRNRRNVIGVDMIRNNRIDVKELFFLWKYFITLITVRSYSMFLSLFLSVVFFTNYRHKTHCLAHDDCTCPGCQLSYRDCKLCKCLEYVLLTLYSLHFIVIHNYNILIPFVTFRRQHVACTDVNDCPACEHHDQVPVCEHDKCHCHHHHPLHVYVLYLYQWSRHVIVYF